MTAQTILEFVCFGNSGRSKPTEAAAQDRIVERGLTNLYQAISSGVGVDAIRAGGFPIPIMQRFTDIAVERGDVYTDGELQELGRAIAEEDQAGVEKIYNIAAVRFKMEEEADRTEALEIFGVKTPITSGHRQTVFEGNVGLVLPMDLRGKGKVIEIYRQAGRDIYGEDGAVTVMWDPKSRSGHVSIATLPGYITGDPNAEAPNMFGLGRRAYINGIGPLIEQAKESVDKFADRQAA